MLRAHFKSEIVKRISNSRYFEPEDFVWKDTEKKLHFTLVYRHEPRFFFSVADEPRSSMAVIVRMDAPEIHTVATVSPGEMRASETVVVPNAAAVIAQVELWLKRIQEELVASPVVRALEEQRSQVEALLAETAKIPQEYFTKEESTEIKDKLSVLEQELRDRLSKDSSENEEVNARITELTQLVAELRTQVDSLTKRGWFGSAIVKFTRWAAKPENSALLKGGINVVKALMPGSEETK